MLRRAISPFLCLVGLAAALVPGAESAADIVEEAKLLASNGAAGDAFGAALVAHNRVSISGDVALVGAPGHDDPLFAEGAAYVYRWDGSVWTEEAQIPSPTATIGDQFGSSVALSGDVAVVGAYPYRGAFMFRYDGSAWVEEASFDEPEQGFGWSVAAFGDVALAGTPEENSDTGSAHVYRYDGTGWFHEEHLLASDGAPGDNFGDSLAVFGDVAVVGAPGDDGKGSVYVFRWNGMLWVKQTKLMASDGASGDHFGRNVSIYGDVILVGADNHNQSVGAAYVFRYDGTTWVEEQKLEPTMTTDILLFGFGVSLSGDTAVIGAPNSRLGGDARGAAYLFRYDGAAWVEEARITPADAEDLDRFGQSVAVSGEVAIFGSMDDDLGIDAGAAYVYRISKPGGKLLSSDPHIADHFGVDVALDGDVAVVGADDHDKAGTNAGLAAVYRFDGGLWQSESPLLAADGAAGDALGRKVAVSGDVALVGAPLDDLVSGADAGSAYVFRYDGGYWMQEAKLRPTGPGTTLDAFGSSVSVSGDVAVVGAPGDDDAATDAGAAYVYRYDGASWLLEAKLLASGGASGDGCGSAVGVFGGVVAVGCSGDDDLGTDSGSVFVYHYTGAGWAFKAHFTPNGGGAGDGFGSAVAVWGDLVVTGAPGADASGGTDSGRAYVARYRGPSYVLDAVLTAADGATDDHFGTSVAAWGDTVVVGSLPFAPGGPVQSGSAYAYRYVGVGWLLDDQHVSLDSSGTDAFGQSVAVSGDIVLVGAERDDESATNAGAAYLFASHAPACADGLDNDGDGYIDYPEDPGCRDAGFANESPQCQDGSNNDADGLIDFDGGQSIWGDCTGLPGGCPAEVSDPDGDGVADPDPQCLASWMRESTHSSGCGLGAEATLVLMGLLVLRRRRGARRGGTSV